MSSYSALSVIDLLPLVHGIGPRSFPLPVMMGGIDSGFCSSIYSYVYLEEMSHSLITSDCAVQEMEAHLPPRHHESFCSILCELPLHMPPIPHHCGESDLF